MSDDLVRLRGYFGQSEANTRGTLRPVSKWGTVCVPEEDVASLLRVGGFHIADEIDPSASNSTVEDVAEVAWHLPRSTVRSTLLAILRSPNSMSHLTQSIAFT
jgi:hypothetical protein